MTNEEAKSNLIGILKEAKVGVCYVTEYDAETLEKAITALEQQPCDQIKWERDTAIAQLKELGYGLGEKPKTDVLDKISAEIDEIETYDGLYIDRAYVLEIIDKYKAESEKK